MRAVKSGKRTVNPAMHSGVIKYRTEYIKSAATEELVHKPPRILCE